jgi:hypothetical protein
MTVRKRIAVGLTLIAMTTVGVATSVAYDTWSVADDATNCGYCHGDFRSGTYTSPVDGQLWGNLHNIHRNTMLSGDCDVCHIGNDEFPVYLDSSNGGTGFDPVGCMGCHGVDPDPTVPDNNWWGAGLRAHHANAGVGPDNNGQTCASCHTDDPTPPPESAVPSYYFTPDTNHPNKPTNPCNPMPTYPEHFAGDVIAIDNDGDLLYDENDPDCMSATLIFVDGFESGDTSFWSSVTELFTALVDRTRNLGGTPLAGSAAALMVFGVATLSIRSRRRRKGGNR